MKLPTLIATSVVRGSEKGQSHGGVYLIDFQKTSTVQCIDWNDGSIDCLLYTSPSPRDIS